MKLHYGGKYRGEEDLIKKAEKPEGAVPFKEPDQKKLVRIGNIGNLILTVAAMSVIYFTVKIDIMSFIYILAVAAIVAAILIIPHEFLHALCFKEDVYLYWGKGIFFVYGTEGMTRRRFVFLSMLPNIVFGIVPFVLFLINHDWVYPGMVGALCIGSGFCDYINVFNALTQMPKGAKTYMDGFHSYWYKE